MSEKMPRPSLQQVEESPETEQYKERLSADYQNIRNEAIKIIDQKMLLIKDELGSNAPEIDSYEAAKEKLMDDQYILSVAKINNWEKIREQDGDDEGVIRGLVTTGLSQH
jgi:hypothetical protein